jgi:hypothetical protein
VRRQNARVCRDTFWNIRPTEAILADIAPAQPGKQSGAAPVRCGDTLCGLGLCDWL